MGYSPEVHEQGAILTGGYNTIKPKAHIVVRRGQFGGMGDVGFERTQEGFQMHVDDYDYGAHGKKFKLKDLNKIYTESKLKKYVNSSSLCNIASRRQNSNGQIEIHLRVTI